MAKLKGVARPENAVRSKHLLKVAGDTNNNKYYDMYDLGDGTFIVFFGRVGADPQIESYPISKWDSKIREKLSDRKGYRDITHLRLESKPHKGFADISDSLVSSLVADLQRFANNLIEQTYLVGAGAVTMAMIAEAQRLIDELLFYTNGTNIDDGRYIRSVNQILTSLYTAIPRKMKNVRDHLVEVRDDRVLQRMIANEQDNLDTMSGQVKNAIAEKDNVDDKHTLLDAIGIQIFNVKPETNDYIRKKLGEESGKFRKAFRIINKRTQERFDNWLESAKNRSVDDFWHGSRNQNWWSILGTGLMLRPTNAVITGKMFGYGLYFADRARKSIGYTSLSGSYWARGNENRAYLALFSVHTGNMYAIDRHRSEFNTYTHSHLRKNGDYDSLYAKAGADLRNPELIVYKEEQATVKYLVEIGQ